MAEQGFSRQKKLEEGRNKQAVADLKKQTLKGGQVTPRTDVMPDAMPWNALKTDGAGGTRRAQMAST